MTTRRWAWLTFLAALLCWWVLWAGSNPEFIDLLNYVLTSAMFVYAVGVVIVIAIVITLLRWTFPD